MVDAWVAIVAAIATGVEALNHFRWAAERAVSEDETQRRLGADQLVVLVSDPNLARENLRRVRAAIKSSLAARLGP